VATADRAGALRTPTWRNGATRRSTPGNRLIAATLEQRWNDAMQRLLELEAELANFERQTLRTITADQKQQILQLASDFPRLWTAQTTAARDRKRMLRLLVKDITVTKGREPKLLRLHIRWQGGAIETVELRLSPNRAEAVRYPDAFVAHIRALAATHDDDEIVALLNRDDLKSSTGRLLHGRHDPLDPPQASHSQPAASHRYIQRQTGSRKIRRQYVGGLLLDRQGPHNSTEEEAWPAIRHHDPRRDRSQTAGVGCQLFPYRRSNPN